MYIKKRVKTTKYTKYNIKYTKQGQEAGTVQKY